MNAIPWYKSTVLVGMLVSIITQLVNYFGLGDSISAEAIESGINGFFTFVSLLAGVIALIARARSKVQPVTLTQAGASNRSTLNSHGAVGLVILCALAFAVGLAGCATNKPSAVTIVKTACERDAQYSTVRCAKGIAETYGIYQESILRLVQDPAVDPAIKERLTKLDAVMTPVAVEGVRLTRLYNKIQGELAAGSTEQEKLIIANRDLEKWIAEAIPRLTALGAALGF